MSGGTKGISSSNLTLVGNGSVGKTSIVQRFQDDGFQKQYKQTLGCDFYEKTMEFRGSVVKCTVWDIGGQSLGSSNLPNYVTGSTVLFLCYDVTDPQSFSDLLDWLSMIQRAFAQKNDSIRKETEEYNSTSANTRKRVKKTKLVPLPKIYLVGNKIDLIGYRRVTEKQHQKFVEDENLSGGFFMSASTGENVLTVFYKVTARTVGIELTSYELDFTKKVLSVVVQGEGGEEKKMSGSEAIEAEDAKAHENVLNMLQAGNQRRNSNIDNCNCNIN